MMYRKLIKGAKRREIDNYAFNAKNGTVTVWQLINKKPRRNSPNEHKSELICRTEVITTHLVAP
jgi:hypothetical protein